MNNHIQGDQKSLHSSTFEKEKEINDIQVHINLTKGGSFWCGPTKISLFALSRGFGPLVRGGGFKFKYKPLSNVIKGFQGLTNECKWCNLEISKFKF